MQVLDVPFIGGGEKMKTAEHGYYIQEAEGELVVWVEFFASQVIQTGSVFAVQTRPSSQVELRPSTTALFRRRPNLSRTFSIHR
jgi:hypothetical protein